MIQDIISRFSYELLTWILIAIAVATPITIFIMRGWLKIFEYKVSISFWIIIASGLVALLIGLLSVGLATYREASRNPAETLRFD